MFADKLKTQFNQIILKQKLDDEMLNREKLLREEIRKNRELLSQSTDDLGNVQTEIVTKNDILMDYTITIEMNLNEEKILTEKIQEMREERERKSKELAEVNDTAIRERETFIERSSKFCNEFGVSGDFHQKWKQNRLNYESLKKQKIKIENQIKSLHEVMECDAIEEDERKSIVADIEFFQGKNKKLIKENLSLKNKLSEYEKEMRVLNDVPNVDPKFRRIKEQIQSLKNANEFISVSKPNTLVNKQMISPKSNANIVPSSESKREINNSEVSKVIPLQMNSINKHVENSEVSKVMPLQMSDINEHVENSETESTETFTHKSYDRMGTFMRLWRKRKFPKEE